jgi:hypothetical protein
VDFIIRQRTVISSGAGSVTTNVAGNGCPQGRYQLWGRLISSAPIYRLITHPFFQFGDSKSNDFSVVCGNKVIRLAKRDFTGKKTCKLRRFLSNCWQKQVKSLDFCKHDSIFLFFIIVADRWKW